MFRAHKNLSHIKEQKMLIDSHIAFLKLTPFLNCHS
jgi:hypothetical protein